MKEQIYEEELRLDCYCGDPHDFVHFGLQRNKETWAGHDEIELELFISFMSYFGSLRKRIKKVFRLILSGRWEDEADVMLVGRDNLEKLRDFCDKCLKE